MEFELDLLILGIVSVLQVNYEGRKPRIFLISNQFLQVLNMLADWERH